MNRSNHFFVVFWLAITSLLATLPVNVAMAQADPPPVKVDLPCAIDVSVQLLGRTPVEEGNKDLVLVRIIWGPGGSIGAHTHPGILWVTVESGPFGLTLLDEGDMSVTRAATDDGEATVEPITKGEEVTLEAGDGFAELGMVHSARNLSDETITTIFSGLVDQGQPLTTCVEEATPAANVSY